MIWADKIAIALAAIIAVFLVLIGSSWGPHQAGYSYALIEAIWLCVLYIWLPTWLLLRLIDLLSSGPTRRRRARLVGSDRF